MTKRLILIPSLLLLLAGCGDHAATNGHGNDHGTAPAAAAATDGHEGHDHGPGAITVSDLVQANLGITWAKAEYRVVQGVVRMPGRFASEPTARRPYQAPLDGRVEVLVRPYQQVAVGTELYRLHSAAWQRLQQEIADAVGAVQAATDNLAAAEEHAAAIAQALTLWSDRLATLDQLGKDLGGKAAERADAAGRVADLRISMAETKRVLAEAVRQARGADGSASGGQAQVRLDLLLSQAAQLAGVAPDVLVQVDAGKPLWASLSAIAVRAAGPGVVEGEVVASGTWISEHTTVLTITDPQGVHLQASGLQADLPRLANGLQARIVAADPAIATSLPATLVLSPVADAIDRSVSLIARPLEGTALPAWVRPGVTANLEVVLDGNADEELAIPVAATIRDGLKTVYFRRDPKDPGQVTKVEADLGASDGRWVVVQSGLKEGDQVVLGGIYPLKLSQQEGGAQAGHFEADGTFHTGKH